MRALLVVALGFTAILAAASGCAIGPEQTPGCYLDAECADGGACRAGACFWTTTGQSPPAADGGDGGDAGRNGN